MRTPRTPRADAARERLPKIGESPDSADSDGGGIEAAPPRADDDWENLELDGSVLEDTPSKPERAAAGRDREERDETECGDAMAIPAAGGEDDGAGEPDGEVVDGETLVASIITGTNIASRNVPEVECVERDDERDTAAEAGEAAAQWQEEETVLDKQEQGLRIKTLKDYVDGRVFRSARGVDLGQIKVGWMHVLFANDYVCSH